MRLASIAAALVAASALSPCASAFTYDMTFNGSGRTQDYLDLGTSKGDFLADIAQAPSTGSLYSVGRAEVVEADERTTGVLFKRLSNGSMDYAFASGSSRMTFGAERSGGWAALTAVAFDASNTGAVMAAGYNDLNNGKRCGVVYKVLDNAVIKGALDGGFGTSGRFSYCSSNSFAIHFNDIKVLADGRVLVAGSSYNAMQEQYGFLLRLTTAGQLDPSFHGTGVLPIDIRPGKNDSALRIAVGAQGYYVGGNTLYSYATVAGRTNDVDLWVARILPSGAFDTSFNGNGNRIEAIDLPNSDRTDLLADLALDGTGRPLLLANVNPDHNIMAIGGGQDPARFYQSYGYVLRLTASGARDTTFGQGGARALPQTRIGCGPDFCNSDEPASLVSTASNDILVAGRYLPQRHVYDTPASRMTLAWISVDGLTVVGDQFTQFPRSEGVSILRQADGKFVIGGLVRTTSLVSDTDFQLSRFLSP